MKKSFYLLLILLFVCIACSRPNAKVPPAGYKQCIYCYGTGKVQQKIRAIKYYVDCRNCGGVGYVKDFTATQYGPTTTTNENKHSTNDKSSGGGYVEPEYETRQEWVDCYLCHGTGRCASCNGDGWAISTRSDGSYNSTYKCPVCHESGTCQACYGNRGHYELRTYRVR